MEAEASESSSFSVVDREMFSRLYPVSDPPCGLSSDTLGLPSQIRELTLEQVRCVCVSLGTKRPVLACETPVTVPGAAGESLPLPVLPLGQHVHRAVTDGC